MEKYMTPEELFHYGVLGMKWGVRKNPSKAFYKASKKANKLQKKQVAANVASQKLQMIGLRKEVRAITKMQRHRATKTKLKASELALKSAALQKKGDRWVKKMEKAFKEVKVSEISQEHMEAGKKYAYMLLDK